MRALASKHVPKCTPRKLGDVWPEWISRYVEIELIEIPGPAGQGRHSGEWVEIEVFCGGLNYRDLNTIYAGLLGLGGAAWAVFGSEIAGVVRNIGPDVTTVAVGDSVTTVFLGPCGSRERDVRGTSDSQCRSYGPGVAGAFMDRVFIHERGVRKIPNNLSLMEAAAFSFSGTLAYSLVHETAKIRPGDAVLITAANSSAGAYTTQLAAKAGAKVVCLSRRQHPAIESLNQGAVLAETLDSLINKESARRKLRRLTGINEFRFVFDFAADRYAMHCLDLLGREGTYFMCGLALPSQVTERLSYRAIIERNLSVRGFEYNHRSFDAAMRLLSAGQAHAIIDSVYRVEKASAALHRAWWSGERFGKVMLLFHEEKECLIKTGEIAKKQHTR